MKNMNINKVRTKTTNSILTREKILCWLNKKMMTLSRDKISILLRRLNNKMKMTQMKTMKLNLFKHLSVD